MKLVVLFLVGASIVAGATMYCSKVQFERWHQYEVETGQVDR